MRISVKSNEIEIDNNNTQQQPHNQKPNVVKSVASWLLAAFIASCVAWVCLWSILAAHTEVARENIYPNLFSGFPGMQGDGNSSSQKVQRDGARLFTYLCCLYWFPGTVALACLWQGIGLPRFSKWMVRHVRLVNPFSSRKKCCCRMTHFEIILAGLFLVVQVATYTTRWLKRFEVEYWENERVWYEVSKTFGKAAALTLVVLFLPVSKSCFWWRLLNFHFERVVIWHKWLAWFLVIIVILHATTAIVPLVKTGQFKNCMWFNSNCQKPGGWENWRGEEISSIYTYGWMAASVATPLVITSLPWFRRHKFELFYKTHVFLSIPFMIFIHLHFQAMIYYVAPGMAAYSLDKLVWCCCARRSSCKIGSVKETAPGFIRLEIACQRQFEEGQWVQICIPAISKLEWHPMSIASAPGHSTITIDIKVVGDWTAKLAVLAAEFDPHNAAHSKIYLDRFYGASHTKMQGYLTHDALLLVAGGIGITPMMSTLRSILDDCEMNQSKFGHIRKLVVVWVVKKMSVVDVYRRELARWQREHDTSCGCNIEIIVHATLSEKEEVVSTETICKELMPDHPTPNTRCNKQQCSFPRFVEDSSQLFLTVLAGGGVTLGIYAANALARDRDWRVEVRSLLRLLLCLIVTVTMIASGMCAILFFAGRRQIRKQQVLEGSQMNMTDVKPDRVISSTEADEQLDVIRNLRPNMEAITMDLASYCEKNGICSVGVSVCGPENLVDDVIKACEGCSRNVDFVVENESFDW